MKKVLAPILSLVTLYVFCLIISSGLFSDIAKFFTWLFAYNLSDNGLNNAFTLVSKLMIFAITYPLVGLIFNLLGWFNSKVMSIVYFILSTLLAMLLCPVLKFVQDNIVAIGIVLIVLFLVIIGLIIFANIKEKKGVLKNDTI